MRVLLLVASLMFFLLSCKKDKFNVENPDVEMFVQQLRNGTYSEYEMGDNGERLWLKMPKFRSEHLEKLILLSRDTTHIEKFPINPLSSRSPWPQGRDYFILGECLLWIVDANIGGGSLDPYLIDLSKELNERFKGISANEILLISDKYKQWWKANKDEDWTGNSPLSGTTYRWM